MTEAKVLITLQPEDEGYTPGAPYRWDDAESVLADAGLLTLLDARYAGPKITVSTSAPSSPVTGDIWFDIS